MSTCARVLAKQVSEGAVPEPLDVADSVAQVRAQVHGLLQLHPDGLLGSQIPVAYKAKYHTSWKEACHGAVASLTDLLATSQFYRIVDTSGTINRFFAL